MTSTTHPPGDIVDMGGLLAVQTLYAILGHEGTADLIDELIEQMNAEDGDPDVSLNGDEEDIDGEGGDWSWPESHGKGLVANVEPLAQHEDSEEDDVAEEDGEDRCIAGDDAPRAATGDGRAGDPDDEEAAEYYCSTPPDGMPDMTLHAFGATSRTSRAHLNKLRLTRCRARYRRQWNIGDGRMWPSQRPDGWELKHEPTVPTRIRRLRRKSRVATNVVAFRRGR